MANETTSDAGGWRRIGTKRDKAFALFDALLDAPEGSNASCDLHDYTGELIEALFSWASVRNVKVERATMHIGPLAVDRYYVCEANRPFGLVCVHDQRKVTVSVASTCLLYTSDAADERSSVDLGGRR